MNADAAARLGRAAMIAAFLAFAFLSAIFQVYDHDVGYHLKTGEWIDAHGRLPDRDPFSFTRAGAPWPIQQGPGAWVLWRAYAVGGVEGLILFKAAIVTLTYAIVLWVAWRESGSLALATAAAMLGVCAGRYRFYERPMLFSALALAALWACLTAWRRRAERPPDRTDGRASRVAPLAAAVVILGVWANVHAGWIDGMIALGGLAAAGTLASVFPRYGLRAERRSEPRPRVRGREAWIALGSALALSVASLAAFNPAGPRVLLIPLTMMRSRWFQSHVAEFQHLPVDNFPAVWALLGLTALALALAWARDRARAGDALVFIAFAWATLTVNRQMLPLSVIAPPILAGHLALLLRRDLPTLGRRRVGVAAGALLVAAMVWIAWMGFVKGDCFRFGFGIDERATPVSALDFIEAHRLPGEVWNEDAWGGAFLWRFWPGRRDFVDNRLDVFDEEFFLREYVPVRAAAPGWEAILQRHGVSTLLMEITDRPIGIQEAAFRSPAWALVYWDDRAEVFVRVSPETRDLVGSYGYRVVNPINLLASLRHRATLPRAIAELERAVAVAPRSWRALNGLGVAYGMAGRYAAASAMFERAIVVDPRSDAARANLEMARRHLGGSGVGPRPGA